MATKKKTPARSTRTSADIAQEYEVVESQVAAAPAVPEKEAALAAARAEGFKSVVKGIGSIENVSKALVDMKLGIANTLDSVSTTLTQKLEELNALNEEIELTKKELAEMYGKEVAAAKLADLVAQHTAKKAELDKEIADARTKYDEEIAEREEEAEEYQTELDEKRTRDEADFNYNLQKKRKEEQDAFDIIKRRRDIDEQLRKESLERGWNERELTLKKAETELNELRTKVAAMPEELKKAGEVAAADAHDKARKAFGFETAMLKKDMESEKALAINTINALRAEVSSKDALIADLQRKLDQATTKVQSIAEKALESQSDRKVSEAVQTMAATTAQASGGRK